MNALSPLAPAGGVQAHASDIEKGLEACHDRLSVLVGRIESVLRPSPPDGPAASTTPLKRVESPLAERQAAHKDAIKALYDRLNDVIERIDL